NGEMMANTPRGSRTVYFSFQAEDGIRDRNVTGVQTCALPISARAEVIDIKDHLLACWHSPPAPHGSISISLPHGGQRCCNQLFEIGRASCRERGEGGGGDGAVDDNRGGGRQEIGCSEIRNDKA